jgi:hypothetical protein
MNFPMSNPRKEVVKGYVSVERTVVFGFGVINEDEMRPRSKLKGLKRMMVFHKVLN